MVGGDQKFPLQPRQGQSEVRTPHLAQECGASMAHAVGCSAWLCSSSCVRCLLVGVEHGGGADGDVPGTNEVVNDCRHDGLT